MKSELDDVAFRLNYDVEHYERCGLDWREDILFEKYEGHLSYKDFQTESFEHPTPVIFQGYLDVVKHIDYPEADNNWNVMSKRMYDVLRSVGEFPHRIIPVAIVDWRVQRKDWRDENGKLREEICLWNYLAVQMSEHLDIFDYEKSKYDTDEDNLKEITFIDEYFFKLSEKGLPPIFKLSVESFYTFVSTEARQAMKKAGINGTRYISLTEGESWVDNPIILPDEVYAWEKKVRR